MSVYIYILYIIYIYDIYIIYIYILNNKDLWYDLSDTPINPSNRSFELLDVDLIFVLYLLSLRKFKISFRKL